MKPGKTILLVLTMFISGGALSQKRFVPGKVVLNSGDTLKGLISDSKPKRGWVGFVRQSVQ